ncbi:hypothetical protein [Marinobacterium aestuariivivens]|uniref:Uncharacterized protein n=1 Tax=Marinobacterium aestuariivivens TaxID=1698799 RepID=A0ABW2A868_9GAMM
MPLIKRYLLKPLFKALGWLALGWVGFSVLLVLLLRFLDPPVWSWLVQRELFPPKAIPTPMPTNGWRAIVFRRRCNWR